MNRIQAGARIREGEEYADLLDEGYRCRFFPVDRRWYPFLCGRALDFYGGSDFPMLQGVWSDAEGRYPWHPTFDARLKQQFPLYSYPESPTDDKS